MTKTRADLFRKLSNDLTGPLGLAVTRKPEKKKTASGRVSIGEIYARSAGRSKLQTLARKIDLAIYETSTWTAMVATLKEMGVSVTQRGKNIVFHDPKLLRRPVRGSRLGVAFTESAIMTRLGREAVSEFVLQPSLIEKVDKQRVKVRVPGASPPTFMIVSSDAINSHGQTSRMFLPQTLPVTLIDKRGAYAGTYNPEDLYQWFTRPNLDPLATSAPIVTRGLTTRQQAYYRLIDRKVEALRDDAAVINIVSDYRLTAPEEKPDFVAALRTRITALRTETSSLVLTRQKLADRNENTDAIDEDLATHARDAARLEKALKQINPPERKHSR
ncbi:Uncharacterised protein [Actinobaculum suis]|uniref:Uncharacterized protein n=2 Tax=Actinobaculum suis TaxID=1657 RepID=A0A7Z8Y7V4_9ACTO|nr:Uncharacterised protein [Actinobaculum suis]